MPWDGAELSRFLWASGAFIKNTYKSSGIPRIPGIRVLKGNGRDYSMKLIKTLDNLALICLNRSVDIRFDAS
jgi:hypothetical protein